MQLEEFKNWLLINGKAKTTIDTYYGHLNRFFKFSNNEINQDIIDKFLLEQRQKNSKVYINVFLNAFKSYCIFKKLNINLPKQQKIKKKEKSYWTLKELETKIIPMFTFLFNNFEEIESLLKIMFYTGLRPKELMNLRQEHIDYEKNIIIVKNGKGEKDRIIPFLNSELKKRLKLIKTNPLFNLSYKQLSNIFKKIKKELYLSYEVNPYIMRRSFAKYCLQEGKDLSIIQQLMGHEDIKTTLIYAEPDEQMVIDACRKTYK